MKSRKRRVDINTIQVEKLQKKVETTNREFVNTLIENVELFSAQMESDSKDLAPADSKELEQSINSITNYRNGVVSSITGSNLEYALRRHEEEYRKGTYHKYHKGVKFTDYYINGRGELTREKKSVRGKLPGRKYLSNAVKINRKNWSTTLKDSFKQAWG
ncbi:HK97 gp10 family phage protein [Staphylococcus hyicus]|uniref:HK97 gp10 family phage protein n=1 Tax=Staphylococcus hyicus TaxID=1284 RepID=UPI00211C2ADC|nr:HK97 gp10 family phage protein [Staphylococcus hyicus]MCQ9290703.1 HK97 gp10 family phage protein [Staphylococcus hyicus]MCQ9305945.1 HK97 gp10 family phage protein [Staphylococcus hyicus]MCQ9308357.1 HK97 gp10 family phage protein [Staphylococcus hyicus]MCQ9310779.1 HK97 gp10 family phage protein [Staphylococcus hyicus]